MARKIFISYKHADAEVQPLQSRGLMGQIFGATARNYVDELVTLLANDHIYKGENDDESLAGFHDDTIASKLRNKIYDSTITIVLISKNMKDLSQKEEDQWIPWEIAYSLREKTREDRTSGTNAILAVVIPDKNGSYGYFIEPVGCLHCGSLRWRKDLLFKILGNNMFNRKQAKTGVCPRGTCGVFHTGNDHSYIHPVMWSDFIQNINPYLDHAIAINQNIADYEIVKIT